MVKLPDGWFLNEAKARKLVLNINYYLFISLLFSDLILKGPFLRLLNASELIIHLFIFLYNVT